MALQFRNPFGISAMSFDPRALDQMHVDSINRTPGDFDEMDCPLCLNRTFIAHLKPDTGYYTTGCSCIPVRKCIREIRSAGLGQVMEQYTFRNYRADTPWQKQLKAGAMAFADNPQGWILFAGQPGSGKSHLCTAIFWQLLRKGIPGAYTSWRETVNELKTMTLDSERRKPYIDRLKTVPLLYIDDLFKTGSGDGQLSRPTATDIGLTFEILNSRYVNRLTTVISTELLPGELKAVDDAIGTRILEMAENNAYTITRSDARNFRINEAGRAFRAALQKGRTSGNIVGERS